MAVVMNRSTNSAPDSSSTSYLMGSAFIGISMMTLNSCGRFPPAVTLLMLMGLLCGRSPQPPVAEQKYLRCDQRIRRGMSRDRLSQLVGTHRDGAVGKARDGAGDPKSAV